MPVYMIREGESGPVKIGFAANPRRRIGALQVSNPNELVLLRLFEGGEVEEALLHARFSANRQRGEWYEFDPAMLDPELLGLRVIWRDIWGHEIPVPGSTEAILANVLKNLEARHSAQRAAA